MDAEELVSTGTFQQHVPHHARVLNGSGDPELVTFYDDEKKSQRASVKSTVRSVPEWRSVWLVTSTD